MFDRIVRNLGTSRSQWWVLAFLSRDDGSPQTNLADELDVGKVALGGLIDRLEEAGMVERRADPIDRRVKRVFLTKEGRRLVSQNKTTMRTLEKMKSNLLATLEAAAPEAGGGDAEQRERATTR